MRHLKEFLLWNIEEIIFWASIIIGIVVIIYAVMFSCNTYTRYHCQNYQEITGKEVRYAEYDSCYVKNNNGFQRWDEYIARSTASELKQ